MAGETTITVVGNLTADPELRFTQSGAAVSVTPASYTSSIPAAGSVTLGFIGSKGATNAAPTAFTLSGSSCATA